MSIERAKNPAAGMNLYREENEINNMLSEEELGRLLQVLRTNENRNVCLFCLFCLFLLSTGARKTESLDAGLDHLDEARRLWRIPAVNAKSRKVGSVPTADIRATKREAIDSLPR